MLSHDYEAKRDSKGSIVMGTCADLRIKPGAITTKLKSKISKEMSANGQCFTPISLSMVYLKEIMSKLKNIK
jgi:hypothetical protein